MDGIRIFKKHMILCWWAIFCSSSTIPQQLEALNRCRLFLQVMILSDIMSADGHLMIAPALSGHKSIDKWSNLTSCGVGIMGIHSAKSLPKWRTWQNSNNLDIPTASILIMFYGTFIVFFFSLLTNGLPLHNFTREQDARHVLPLRIPILEPPSRQHYLPTKT